VANPSEAVIAYVCPVCGIELSRSDFDTPAADYYCPYCSSQQTPQQVPGKVGW